MKAFSVLGTSGTGKTTTIEAIIAELRKRGFRVGSVKDIHFDAFAMDTPGSNTHRHRQAGADLVTARGQHETDLLFPTQLPMRDVLRHYAGYDWVVLEGVADLPVPNVICTPDKQNEFTICAAGKYAGDLRCFDARTQAAELCDFLLENVPVYLECFDPAEPQPAFDISLKINGEEIRMVPFVQKILRNAVLAVAAELEGYQEGATIDVQIKKK
ncbi:MAG: molybdopterin-guanine dinucleotide biosynthesis protein MobB [Oscillospiraceae bacterium]|nr:molybdopterin-guanine dinucleotide biosynthesis protein MobB [Oscillospiraceae bacterium]